MNICVVGWYFRPKFIKALESSRRNVFVIKHREGDSGSLPSKPYPNIGLEFGAYRQYMDNHWDGRSAVLFCHDDTEILSSNALDQIETLEERDINHAYIFQDECQEVVNGGIHGRAMWCRGAWLKELQMVGGIPYDETNRGDNTSQNANRGCFAFHERIKAMGSPNVALAAVVPSMRLARRGWLAQEMYVFNRPNGSVVTPNLEEASVG